jgi:hypothetical protein
MGKQTISHADRFYAGDGLVFNRAGADSDVTRGLGVTLMAIEYLGIPGAANTQGVVANVAAPGAGALTLLTASGVNLTPTRNVTITSNNAGDVTQNVIVVGLDANGLPQAEQINFAGAATVQGVKTFSKITRAQLSAVVAGTISVGFGIVIGLRAKIRNLAVFKMSFEANVLVAGAAFSPGNNTVQTATTADQRAKYTPTTPASDLIVMYDADLTRDGMAGGNYIDLNYQRQVTVP